MTFEMFYDGLINKTIKPIEINQFLEMNDNKKKINYFINRDKITKEPLSESETSQLNTIVGILQIIYNSGIESPMSDNDYDILQEMLINAGLPRLSGSFEINDNKKESHKYTQLRGTLDKIYYLNNDEKRTNPSRKYLDDWIKSTNNKYKKNSGKDIDINECVVICQNKFDGIGCTLEIDENGNKIWITRGDTTNNRASNVSHIMNQFNDLYNGINQAIQFEVCMSEENKDKINEIYREQFYKNSRQIVSATINSKEADYKIDYIYPIPLRVIKQGDEFPQIHPTLIEKFPTLMCKLSDRDKIREFANKNKFAHFNGMNFRTDGTVMTIIDPDVQRVLGRDNNINNYEVALKHTEEKTKSTVNNIEWYVSSFGFITPVVVVEDVKLKGNTINHISLSNLERMTELNLHYGDEVIVSYDIIPYVTIDETCIRSNKRKIDVIRNCPKCNHELNLNVIQLQCDNQLCPSKLIGRIINYCKSLRIQNIGESLITSLYDEGLLKNGIRSLYKLKKHRVEMECISGIGKLTINKIINEIESKRRLYDYEFLGAYGIESLSIKTFESICNIVKFDDFIDMITNKQFDKLKLKLIDIDGIGDKKADILIRYMKDSDRRKEFLKLIDELNIKESYGVTNNISIAFTGCRPSNDEIELLKSSNINISDSINKNIRCLIALDANGSSTKNQKANKLNIPIVSFEIFKDSIRNNNFDILVGK